MGGTGDIFAGAAAGALFSVLYDVVKDVKDTIKLFKTLLVDLSSTLESLKPLMEDIAKHNKELDRPKEELEIFEKQIRNGADLVRKCSKVVWWDGFKRYKYASKLSDLVKCLNRLFDIVNVMGTRDGLQTLTIVTVINDEVKDVKGELKDVKEEVKVVDEGVKRLEVSFAELKETKNVVVPYQREIGAWCAVPEPLPITVGLDAPLRELKKKLLKDGESRVVLTAPGGCGKTTLATKFCQDKEVKDTFKDNILFVTVSTKPNLEHIIQELYQRKRYQVPTFHNDAVKWLQHFLKEEGQNPLLLVLDDVWPGSESLLEMFDQFQKPNYKILVTSRSEFSQFGSSYNLESLNYNDATELFHHSASLGDKSSYIPKVLATKIVEHCKGFPLAITVVGKSLCGKPPEFWRERVRDWSKGYSILHSDTALLLCLQSSLDALEGKEAIIKECFMDLGSFPEDQRIPASALIDMWAELYELDEDFLSIKKLQELTARSLANLVVLRKENMEVVDDYYSEHFVTQHDMLRELAIYQAKLDSIEHRKRLIIDMWRQSTQVVDRAEVSADHGSPLIYLFCKFFADGVFSKKWLTIQLPEVEVLVLNFQTKNYAMPEFVENIEKLRVLIVTNNGFLPAELGNFQLLGSLSNLKRIRLERISIPSITKNFVQLESLKKRSLFMCNIGEAFKNGSIQISDAFPSLEEMNIDYCHDLVELPAELCDLIHLKKLSITNCHKLSALPEGIGKLEDLEVLRLRSCTDLVQLPGSIKNLAKLKFLDISDCFSIKELPEEFGEISSLTMLNMRQCSRLKELPLSVLNLKLLKEVVCDDETGNLWEPFLSKLSNTSIKVARENINLNWLHKL